MLPTVECRWWLPGRVPARLLSWFEQFGDVHHDDSRIDHYLLLPGWADLGVKARAGDSVEVKARVDVGPTRPLARNVSGKLEHWRKWHFPVASSTPGVADLDVAPEHWVAVHKNRWQLELSGCEVEIAQVAILGQEWHSLGLEAPDGDPGSDDTLTAAVAELAEAGVGNLLALTDSACHGYPRQILEVAGLRAS